VKIAGILGGIGPESTIEYYRQIVAAYRSQARNDSYPSVVINSIDMTKMLGLFGAGRLTEVTGYLLGEIARLSRAGAEFGAVAANTPHVVFDALRRGAAIPLISIVDVTCQAARARGLKRVGLFGTRFTMQGHFYQEAFTGAGMEVRVPTLEEQTYIHDVYLGELVKGVILPETREGLLAIVDRMRMGDGIEGLILGGTELPLILREASYKGVPFLDTTQLHVERIVRRLLEP
jgi:aspartate racemase